MIFAPCIQVERHEKKLEKNKPPIIRYNQIHTKKIHKKIHKKTTINRCGLCDASAEKSISASRNTKDRVFNHESH